MAKVKKEKLSLEELLEQALVKEEDCPYEVPENWIWTRLESIMQLISGRDISANLCNDYGMGIPYILGASSLQDNSFIAERWIQNPQVISKKDDILISIKGTIGKVYLQVENEINISRQIMALRALNKINVKYLKNFLDNISDELKQNGNGLIPGISREILLKRKFPLPPLSEQQRIVDTIESLFEKLDCAKELTQNTLDSFENRRAAILHKAFTGELTAKWREENGVGLDEWETRSIETLGEVKGGKRLPKGKLLVNENTGFPYIRAGDLKNGTVLTDKLQFVTEDVQKVIKNYTVKTGDVYVTIVGACIGDVGVIPEEVNGANLTENAAKITNLTCDSKYLGICLENVDVQKQIKDKISSATLGKLSLLNIKSLIVPIPSFAEQQEIVRILDNLLENEQRAKELCDIIEKIELMKKAILARAFRGELGTNDPEEESAVELLKEVLGSTLTP